MPLLLPIPSSRDRADVAAGSGGTCVAGAPEGAVAPNSRNPSAASKASEVAPSTTVRQGDGRRVASGAVESRRVASTGGSGGG
ncbi:MAG TPA: hypothetical protein VLJ38_15415, partial [Polyangiaceae bacterium]|nr:hypothetical protein [Polyangiaceae bacterium]